MTIPGVDIEAYVFACEQFFLGQKAIARKSPDYCPECDRNVPEDCDDSEFPHRYAAGVLVVGCEGYFVVDPNLMGFNMPAWLDWQTNDLWTGEPKG